MKQAEFIRAQESHSSFGQQGAIHSLCLSDDGQQLLTGSDAGRVQLFHTNSGNCRQTFNGHYAAVNTVIYSIDNQYAISGSEDKTIKVWDLQQGSCLQTLIGHKGGIRYLQTLPDDRLLVSCSDDKTLRIWDFPSGQCLQVLKGHQRPVSCCHSLSDWQYLLSGGEDKTIKLWNLSTAKKIVDIGSMGGHVANITAIKASYDDQIIVSASRDCTIRLWDIVNNKSLNTISAHASAITDMSLSLNGRHAVSVARDGEVKLWQLPEGKCLSTLRNRDDEQSKQHSILLSNDRGQVIVTNQQGGVTFYSLEWDFRSVPLSDDNHEVRQAYYAAFIRQQTHRSILRNVKSAASEISITGNSSGNPRWQKPDLHRFSKILLNGLHVRINADQLGNNLKAYLVEQADNQHVASLVEEAKKAEKNESLPPGFTHLIASGIPGHIRHYLSDTVRMTTVILVLIVFFVIGNLVRLQINDHIAKTHIAESIHDGADINQIQVDGVVALHAASSNGQKETIRYMLSNGVDINMPDHNGWSALHYAAAMNDDDMVEFLLEQSASPVLKAGTSMITPMWIARRNDNADIVLMMKKTMEETGK